MLCVNIYIIRGLYRLRYGVYIIYGTASVNKLDARLDEKFSVSSQFINGTQ